MFELNREPLKKGRARRCDPALFCDRRKRELFQPLYATGRLVICYSLLVTGSTHLITNNH